MKKERRNNVGLWQANGWGPQGVVSYRLLGCGIECNVFYWWNKRHYAKRRVGWYFWLGGGQRFDIKAVDGDPLPHLFGPFNTPDAAMRTAKAQVKAMLTAALKRLNGGARK